MTKAIFLDVDGTLISFKTHRVPASALDALREAHARGVQLFIATGRAAADLADLEAIPYDGVAALNGADCLMRDGRVVARHPIPRADFEKSLALSTPRTLTSAKIGHQRDATSDGSSAITLFSSSGSK